MIQPPECARATPGPRPAFVALWASGPDPALDDLVRVQALRPGAEPGSWERLDLYCAPRDESGIAGARVARELGVTRADLIGARSPEAAWRELLAFAGPAPLFVADPEPFEAWHAHLAGGEPPLAVSLTEVAALCLPGRLGSRGEALVGLLAGGVAGTSIGTAFGPEDLRAALLELARRVHALDLEVLRLLAVASTRAWRALAETDPRAATRLGLALALLDLPRAWSGGVGLDYTGLEDGRIAALARADEDVAQCLAEVRPACAREAARWAACEALPAGNAEALPFHEDDLRVLDDVFQVHLPAGFGAASGGGARASGPYRASQHGVAREVARSLGTRELLLVHAPTGTGKTLAYLVPCMLWARRHGVRVAVATYTRALQEQALDREVPRALSALARAGVPPGTRVGLLKGRENYLCWRALKLAEPEDETAESWLAWAQIALFGATDLEGDLDRLPRRPPLRLASPAQYVRALESMLRTVRSQMGCCPHVRDREQCAAELARKRAEKSHVVLVNQAFALARPEFFRRIVFDECEHLHEQAHNAWSRTLGFRELRQMLARLYQPGKQGSRSALARMARDARGTPAAELVRAAARRVEDLGAAVTELERECEAFDAWRMEELRTRPETEQHFLMREYAARRDSDGGGSALVLARVEVARLGGELDAGLAELAEIVQDLPARGSGALRRALDLVRGELAEIQESIRVWIPMREGEIAFENGYFYDVERDARGGMSLAARVLLPQEVLGSRYYPDLDGAVFLSASTWIRGSFESATAYLGLDRAARPAVHEERLPCTLATHKAPDVFDWSRVLVAIPKDAPAVREKSAFLAYVRDFVAHLGERTRGRMLVLFTNAQDMAQVGRELEGFFRARRIPFWFQGQAGTVKEELGDLFRSRVDSVLMGVDTFWYGADFPGETLEYLVIVKLPYGVPDRYHHAQCAAIGVGEQRRQIYMPRALAKFRQGFGRLMRRETDKGCVFLLDHRVVEARHRAFLKELPVASSTWDVAAGAELAREVLSETDGCVHAALAHMQMLADARRRGLDAPFDRRGAESSEATEPA